MLLWLINSLLKWWIELCVTLQTGTSLLAALFSSCQGTFTRSFQSSPEDPMQTLSLHQSRTPIYGNLLRYSVFWKICGSVMPLLFTPILGITLLQTSFLPWQQRARNHRWGLHQVSKHDGTPTCEHMSHGYGHLPSTTRGPSHKRVFAWTPDFGSLQQGGFTNKHDGFKLPSKRTRQLPQCGFRRGHGSGEYIPFRVPQHFGNQWHAFTQVVVQDWRTNDDAAQSRMGHVWLFDTSQCESLTLRSS